MWTLPQIVPDFNFLDQEEKSLQETLKEKEKMLETNNVFYLFEKNCTIWATSTLSSANAFNFYKAKSMLCG